MSLQNLLKVLEAKIESAYQQGTTLEEAERLASEFLSAQIKISTELTKADLNARTRKSGVKAVRAAVYLNAATASEKKPTEAMLAATVDSDKIVCDEQDGLDKAEVSRAELERYYDIMLNAHIHFRGISKGKFGE